MVSRPFVSCIILLTRCRHPKVQIRSESAVLRLQSLGVTRRDAIRGDGRRTNNPKLLWMIRSPSRLRLLGTRRTKTLAKEAVQRKANPKKRMQRRMVCGEANGTDGPLTTTPGGYLRLMAQMSSKGKGVTFRCLPRNEPVPRRMSPGPDPRRRGCVQEQQQSRHHLHRQRLERLLAAPRPQQRRLPWQLRNPTPIQNGAVARGSRTILRLETGSSR